MNAPQPPALDYWRLEERDDRRRGQAFTLAAISPCVLIGLAMCLPACQVGWSDAMNPPPDPTYAAYVAGAFLTPPVPPWSMKAAAGIGDVWAACEAIWALCVIATGWALAAPFLVRRRLVGLSVSRHHSCDLLLFTIPAVVLLDQLHDGRFFGSGPYVLAAAFLLQFLLLRVAASLGKCKFKGDATKGV